MWYFNENPNERAGEVEVQVPTWADTSVQWQLEEAKNSETAHR